VFVTIQGERQYLWRAIDQDGDVIDILLQRRRNGRAAKRFFRKLLKRQQRSPNRLVTDKLGSYRVAHREEMAGVPHDTIQASLIGAKGLGEDVLEALQYAAEGAGMSAGLAILLCAMVLDRIVQGKGVTQRSGKM